MEDHRKTVWNAKAAKEINAQYKAEEEQRAAQAAQGQDVRTDSEKIEDLFFDSKGHAYKSVVFKSDKEAAKSGAIKSDSGEWVIPVIVEHGAQF